MSFSFLDFFFFSLGVMSTSIVICGQSFAFSLCNQAMSMMTWGYQEEMFLMLWSHVCVCITGGGRVEPQHMAVQCRAFPNSRRPWSQVRLFPTHVNVVHTEQLCHHASWLDSNIWPGQCSCLQGTALLRPNMQCACVARVSIWHQFTWHHFE